MLQNILMDKGILKAWLKAGYVDKGKLYPTKAGTPQGGIASPVLANMTLDGLETAIKTAVPQGSKVNVIRYADDFIVTGKSRQILQDKVVPAIDAFLTQRGLNLSGEKTKITRIEDGFDFLGQHLRKYGDKCILTPSKGAVKSLLAKTRKIIKNHSEHSEWKMIEMLNPIIRGWANYHRHICSKKTFSYVDSRIFWQIWKRVVRKHSSKAKGWIQKRYFRSDGFRNWIFSATQKTDCGETKILDLFYAASTKILRHVKIRSAANPYDKIWQRYFSSRVAMKYFDTVMA